MFLGRWFWMALDDFGCLQVVLGGFKWFLMACGFSSYGESRCFKFKRSKQLWRVFLISSNKALRLKWPSFCVIQLIKFHLKRPWVGERSFVLWKSTYIAFCKFILFRLRFSPFWGNLFKDFFKDLASYCLAGLYSRLSICQMFLFIVLHLFQYQKSSKTTTITATTKNGTKNALFRNFWARILKS